MKNSIFREESYELMGAAFEVYNEMGSGLLEEIYQESLEIELGLRAIPFRCKQELAVFYKARELQKRYIADLHVFGAMIVELQSGCGTRPRTPSAGDQLYAYCAPTGGLSDQFRSSRYS
jgi:GxxExxY protein